MRTLWDTIKKLKGEAVGIPLALLLFFYVPYVLRWIDPTAGAYDAGVLHLINLSIVSVLVFSLLSWIGMAINFKEVFSFLQVDFVKDFKTLTAWQKVKIGLFIYSFHVLVFVLMAKAI